MYGLGHKDCYDACSVCDVAGCCDSLEEMLEKLAHYEDLEEQGYRMVNINKIIEQLEELEKEYPYRVVGEPETYSQYNAGWRDCIDRAIGIVKGSE